MCVLVCDVKSQENGQREVCVCKCMWYLLKDSCNLTVMKYHKEPEKNLSIDDKWTCMAQRSCIKTCLII